MFLDSLAKRCRTSETGSVLDDAQRRRTSGIPLALGVAAGAYHIARIAITRQRRSCDRLSIEHGHDKRRRSWASA
jgi:hypothetical protein